MTQTSVNLEPPVARAGLPADNSSARDVVSKAAGETILFGNFVSLDTATGKAIRPDAAALITNKAVRLGISRCDESMESKNDGLDPNYSANELASVITSGRVYVKSETPVALGDTVHIRHANKPEIITIFYDIDFQAGDSVDITINNVLVATAFNTNNATTYGDVDTNITAATAGIVQDVTVDATARSIEITAVLNTDITVTAADTAGGAVANVIQTQQGTSVNTIGAVRTDVDGGTATALTDSRFVSECDAGGFAVLELNVL